MDLLPKTGTHEISLGGSTAWGVRAELVHENNQGVLAKWSQETAGGAAKPAGCEPGADADRAVNRWRTQKPATGSL